MRLYKNGKMQEFRHLIDYNEALREGWKKEPEHNEEPKKEIIVKNPSKRKSRSKK